MKLSIFLLTLGTVAIGADLFVIAGILPYIAGSFAVSVPLDLFDDMIYTKPGVYVYQEMYMIWHNFHFKYLVLVFILLLHN